MRKLYLTVFTLAVVFCNLAAAQKNPCATTNQIEREKKASVRNWDALFKYYRLYGRCDDPMAAEASSESIARILVDHWETLPRLAELTATDTGFRRFVRLDSTMDSKDLTRVRANAIKHCPDGLNDLCARLKNQANAAMKEQGGSISTR
jgi:hypothetical protein